ncbi:MAG: hypothetical protein Q7K55_00380 [Candidatus Levybacteria bacterium]|nr:hypothetical protein [Candidatus Levybacteria bacterium]
MKKIGFLLPLLGLLFTTTAFAYSGSHNFLSMTTTSSNGHSYKSEFNGAGKFPFNGLSSYDGSRVNLKGTFNVSERDGVTVSESYCTVLNGNLKTTGGKLTATLYSDSACSQVAGKTVYTVSSYQEDNTGNFTVSATDGSGVVYSTSGSHQYSR